MKKYIIEVKDGNGTVKDRSKGVFATEEKAREVSEKWLTTYIKQRGMDPERKREQGWTVELTEVVEKAADGSLKEEVKQERQKGGKRGERTQTMRCFRIDNDLLPLLDMQANKGRFVNNVLRAALQGPSRPMDERPEEFEDRTDRRA